MGTMLIKGLMNPKVSSVCVLATVAVSLATATGCGPGAVDEDTDDNKSFYVDGYQEVSAPSPATGEARCEYGMAASNGSPGVDVNMVLPGTLTWEGFRPGEDTPSFINVSEFFDCGGTRGIDALVVDTSQYG